VAGNRARFLLERRRVRTDRNWRELVDEPPRRFERDPGARRVRHSRGVRPVLVVAGPDEDDAPAWDAVGNGLRRLGQFLRGDPVLRRERVVTDGARGVEEHARHKQWRHSRGIVGHGPKVTYGLSRTAATEPGRLVTRAALDMAERVDVRARMHRGD